MAKLAGILAIPVYPWWLRINVMAKHEALFPTQGPTLHEQWLHIEVSTARGLVPMSQKFSSSVEMDGHTVAVQGHDFGPMAPHFCVPLDNSMLPTTLLGSKCAWPITATRRKADGKPICAFRTFLVPYVHCHARKKDDSGSKDKSKGKNPASRPQSDKSQGRRANVRAKASESINDFMNDLPNQLPGAGFVMIPIGSQTAELRLGLVDFLVGMANFAVDLAFDTAWKRLGFNPKRHIKGLQPDAARRLAQTYDAVVRHFIEKMLERTAKDLVKGFLSSAELRAPFKLAKLDLKTGKVVVWHKEVDNVGWKISDTGVDYRGWSKLLNAEPPPGLYEAEARAADALNELLGDPPHAE